MIETKQSLERRVTPDFGDLGAALRAVLVGSILASSSGPSMVPPAYANDDKPIAKKDKEEAPTVTSDTLKKHWSEQLDKYYPKSPVNDLLKDKDVKIVIKPIGISGTVYGRLESGGTFALSEKTVQSLYEIYKAAKLTPAEIDKSIALALLPVATHELTHLLQQREISKILGAEFYFPCWEVEYQAYGEGGRTYRALEKVPEFVVALKLLESSKDYQRLLTHLNKIDAVFDDAEKVKALVAESSPTSIVKLLKSGTGDDWELVVAAATFNVGGNRAVGEARLETIARLRKPKIAEAILPFMEKLVEKEDQTRTKK